MANIIDSYSESNFDSVDDVDSVDFTGLAQTFTGNGATLGSSKFYIRKFGSPTGSIVSKIYNITGTFGSSSKPTGSALAISNNVDISTLTTSNALIIFNFSGANQITLTNATHYAASIEYSGGNGVNTLEVGEDASSPTAAGNYSTLTSGTWTANSTIDLCFYVYDNTGGSPTVTGVSSVTGISTITF